MANTVIIDIMGGDNAPEETIKGVKLALQENKNLNFILVGDEEKSEYFLNDIKDNDRVSFENVKFIKEEEYKIKRNSNTCIGRGLQLLKEKKGDVFISAGNTGKVVAESFMKVGKSEGVERPAIAVALPTLKKPVILLDVGANSDCRPVHFHQFAILGAVYSKILLGMENADPKVGLLNIGTESKKGSKLYQLVFSQFKKNKNVNFIGNIETNSMICGDVADVVVCDGFSGNIVLKSMEGLSNYVLKKMKDKKVAPELIKSIASDLDYQEYGGALLLGVKEPVVICHGKSSAFAIKNAVKFSTLMAENNIVNKISEKIKDFNKQFEYGKSF
ncbi:MAG: phosphate acyltransferase PlsX [Candidatus Muiribacteriota bacterium]